MCWITWMPARPATASRPPSPRPRHRRPRRGRDDRPSSPASPPSAGRSSAGASARTRPCRPGARSTARAAAARVAELQAVGSERHPAEQVGGLLAGRRPEAERPPRSTARRSAAGTSTARRGASVWTVWRSRAWSPMRRASASASVPTSRARSMSGPTTARPSASRARRPPAGVRFGERRRRARRAATISSSYHRSLASSPRSTSVSRNDTSPTSTAIVAASQRCGAAGDDVVQRQLGHRQRHQHRARVAGGHRVDRLQRGGEHGRRLVAPTPLGELVGDDGRQLGDARCVAPDASGRQQVAQHQLRRRRRAPRRGRCTTPGGARPAPVGAMPASTASRTRACTHRRPAGVVRRPHHQPGQSSRWRSDRRATTVPPRHRPRPAPWPPGPRRRAPPPPRRTPVPSGPSRASAAVDDAGDAGRDHLQHVGRHVEAAGQLADRDRRGPARRRARRTGCRRSGRRSRRARRRPGRWPAHVADELGDAVAVEGRHLDDLEVLEQAAGPADGDLEPLVAGGRDHGQPVDARRRRRARGCAAVERSAQWRSSRTTTSGRRDAASAEDVDRRRGEHGAVDDDRRAGAEVGRRPGHVELAEELGERTQSTEVVGLDRGVDHGRAVLVADPGQLGGEARLAHAGRTDEHAAGPAAAAADQLVELAVADR